MSPEARMLEYVSASLPLALFFAIGLALMAYLYWMRRFRTDLEKGQSFLRGRSMFAELNLFDARNYTPEGREKLRWAWLLTALQLVTLLWAIGSWDG